MLAGFVHVYGSGKINIKETQYLINMDEHHEGIPFTGSILFLLKERVNQLWCIRDEEVKISGEKQFLGYYPFDPLCVTRDNIDIPRIFWMHVGVIQTLEINHMRSNATDGIRFQRKAHPKEEEFCCRKV